MMKKIKLSLVIALLGIVSLVSAQSASLNIKGGLNMSNFYGKNLSDKNINPGFHIGVGADLEFITNVSIQTGLYFTTKGSEYTADNIPSGVGDVTYKVTTNYIQLPIHVAYKMEIKPGTRVFFHAGPYLAYGVGGSRDITAGWEGNEVKIGPKDSGAFKKDWGYKPFDVGVGLGVGIEFDLFFIDLGWDMGLKNIARNINEIPVYKPNVKNQSAYLSIGYKF